MITLETRAPSDTSTPELETKSSSFRFLFSPFFLSSLTFLVVSKLCTYVRTYSFIHGCIICRYIFYYVSAQLQAVVVYLYLRASYIRTRGIEPKEFHRFTKLIRVHRRACRRNRYRNVSHRRNIGYVRKKKILYNRGLSIGLCKPFTSVVLTYISKIRVFLSAYVGKITLETKKWTGIETR